MNQQQKPFLFYLYLILYIYSLTNMENMLRMWTVFCSLSFQKTKQEATSNAVSWSIFVFWGQCLENPPAGSRWCMQKDVMAVWELLNTEQRLFRPSSSPLWFAWLITRQNFWLMCSLQSRVILTSILSSGCFHSIIVLCMGQTRAQVLSILGWPWVIVCFCLVLSRRQANIFKLTNLYNLSFS